MQIDFNRITAFVPETGTPLQIKVIGVIHGALPGCFNIDFAEVEGASPLSHGECIPGVALDNFGMDHGQTLVKATYINLIAKVEQEIIPIRVLMKKDCYHPNWNDLEILFVQSDTSSFFQVRANYLGQNNLPG